MQRDLAFIDTETTGLDALAHEMIEIAVIRTDPTGRKIKSQFEAKLWPTNMDAAEPEALRINKFNERWIKSDCAPPMNVAKKLMAELKDVVLVAHNLPFDEGFTRQFLRRMGFKDKPWYWMGVDTFAVWYPLAIKRGSNAARLAEIAKELGVPHDPSAAHGAMYDALVLRAIFLQMAPL